MKIYYDDKSRKFTIEITEIALRKIVGGLYFVTTILEEDTEWEITTALEMLRERLHKVLLEARE